MEKSVQSLVSSALASDTLHAEESATAQIIKVVDRPTENMTTCHCFHSVRMCLVQDTLGVPTPTPFSLSRASSHMRCLAPAAARK